MTRRAWAAVLSNTFCLAFLGSGLVACSEGDAQKSWNELSTCLAGSAAQSPLAVRMAQLRSIALANPAPSSQKSAWPARCAGHADDLYASLGSDSEFASLKRKLHERLACTDNKGTCTLPTDSSLISVTTELWEAASHAGLKNEPAPGVIVPKAAAPAVLDAHTWKSFSDRSLSLVGPLLTVDGRAVVILKPSEGRGKPRGCEFSRNFSSVSCSDAHSDVPDLPVQTVDLVADGRGLYAAGLTEHGLFAFDLKSGQKSEVRGLGPLRLTRDGLAVEHAEKDDGYQVSVLTEGKASKPVKLPSAKLIGEPLALGDQVVYLQQTDGQAQGNAPSAAATTTVDDAQKQTNAARGRLIAKSVLAGRLKDQPIESGVFSGALHGCRTQGMLAVGAYGARAGLHNAQPTAGAGKTQLTVTLFQGNLWSKPSSVTIPFARGIDSDLVCTKTGASLAYAQTVPDGALVGRVDCRTDGCQANEVKLPGVESKWWWAVGPLGDKLLVMWRSALGETRLRLAPLAALPNSKDVIVFDAPDFGGPNAGELSALYADDDALLIFRGEKPVALHVSSDGSVRPVAP